MEDWLVANCTARCSQIVSHILPPGEYKRGERFRLQPSYFGPCCCCPHCLWINKKLKLL